jgi:hypothetical protein
MPGDQIFSPTWEPGRAEHFALAGTMDIDGDGEDDRERLRDLIAMNGGVIDEEIDAAGKKQGEMTINTKYLVRGEAPKAVEESTSLAAWSDINGRAQTLGIRIISVQELLKYMAYKPEDRTVTLGADVKSSDFKARLPADAVQRVLPNMGPARDLRRPPPTRDDF